MTLPQKKFRQQSFFKPTKKSHGGSLDLKKRKTIRPLDTKMPLHVILKSEKAKGIYSLVKFNNQILATIRKQAAKFHITVYQENINFNHIHLLIRGKTRRDIQNFFRALAGNYIVQNNKEVLGLIPYQKRNHRYKNSS